MKSYEQHLNNVHFLVGEYLYKVQLLPYSNEDEELWDFYDLYPNYVYNMLSGRGSLDEIANFTMYKFMTELIRIMRILESVWGGKL